MDRPSETKVEVEETEANPDVVVNFSRSLNDPSAEFISAVCDGGGEHVEVTDSSLKMYAENGRVGKGDVVYFNRVTKYYHLVFIRISK